jgi:hypothetical protein
VHPNEHLASRHGIGQVTKRQHRVLLTVALEDDAFISVLWIVPVQPFSSRET